MMLLKLVAAATPGFSHSVVSLRETGSIGQRLMEIGTPLTALNFTSWRSSPACLRLSKIIRGHKPDVIQGWMYHGNLVASLAAVQASRRKTLSWSIRLSLDEPRTQKLTTRGLIRAGAYLSGLPRAIIYNSWRAQGQHESLGYSAAGSHVIGNGFDTDLFRPDAGMRGEMRRELGVGDDTVLLGIVGRASPQKDHATFLRVAAELAAENPRLAFVMAGRGVPEELLGAQDLLPLVRAMGKRLILVPEQRDVQRIMNAMDLFVLSSMAEGFPNVVGEAMACGLPCVTTDVGDCRVIVGDTGLVVPPKDPPALANALREMLALDPAQRRALGAAARARVVSEFSLAACVRQYESRWMQIAAAGEG